MQLFHLQGMLFLMVLVGLVLKRRGVIDEAGKRCLTDLCVDVIIPCSIVKAFLMDLDPSVLRSSALLLAVGTGMQLICMVLNRFLFNRFPTQQKKVLQYCTLCSNGGFLGNPIAEGVYGNLGLLYASIYLIPMRIVMWSVGTSYFSSHAVNRKQALRNVLTHPCLVAVYAGLFLMLTQFPLPVVVVSTIKSIGGCNSAMTMFIVGTILAEVPLRTIFTPTTLAFSVLRLAILPGVTLAVCWLVGLDPVASGVATMMSGMPAAAMAAVFAARYDSDAPFATRCVVLSTLLSMLSIPIWCWFIG